ncbi:MAG: general secretion pathway protein GspB [Sphingomonadaceae bacterium]
MSYILEALKKAQAERQLGATPTIHAPVLQAAASQPAPAGMKKSLLFGGLVALVLVGGGLLLMWDKAPMPAAPSAPPAPVTVAASAPTPVQPYAVAPSALPVAQSAVAHVSAAPAAPAIAFVAPPPAAAAAANAPSPQASAAANVLPPQAARDRAPAAAASTPTPAAVDEVSQTLRDLPEPIQRALPPITVGGYIYSKNPADRLLLIDKVLRHEGEEVAPGLLLEKLQPKAAIFNYKGYRYRVPY